jgi:arsenate reductase (thioredoxin)
MTEADHRLDWGVDHALALQTAAARLAQQFGGVLGIETIERFLRTSSDQFADRAVIRSFLPLLAERFARQRLQVLAGGE